MERMDNRSMHDGVFGLVRHGTARSQGAMELGGRFFFFSAYWMAGQGIGRRSAAMVRITASGGGHGQLGRR